jgi:hypothetical protein
MVTYSTPNGIREKSNVICAKIQDGLEDGSDGDVDTEADNSEITKNEKAEEDPDLVGLPKE